jgi:hypothetical protein
MKQTAVEKMIQYFIEQKNNGVSHWCINDLIGQLYQAKEMEKEQIIEAHGNKEKTRSNPNSIVTYGFTYTGEMYYNEIFKGIKER